MTPAEAQHELVIAASAMDRGDGTEGELEAAALVFARSCGWEEPGAAEQLAAVIRVVLVSLERNDPGADEPHRKIKPDREVAISMLKNALREYDASRA